MGSRTDTFKQSKRLSLLDTNTIAAPFESNEN